MSDIKPISADEVVIALREMRDIWSLLVASSNGSLGHKRITLLLELSIYPKTTVYFQVESVRRDEKGLTLRYKGVDLAEAIDIYNKEA